MASGDTLCKFTMNMAIPTTGTRTPATHDTRGGANNIQMPCLDFDASADEYAAFFDIMPRHYGGSGVTVYLHVAFTNDDDSGDPEAQFEVCFARIGAGQVDLDDIVAGLAAAQDVQIVVPATCGHVAIGSQTFANGGEMDSIAVGEGFALSVMLDESDSDFANDAELIFVELKET